MVNDPKRWWTFTMLIPRSWEQFVRKAAKLHGLEVNKYLREIIRDDLQRLGLWPP